MNFNIVFRPRAHKHLRKIPLSFSQNILSAIEKFEKEPFPAGKKFKKLRGCDEYRLRVGDYHIFYIVDFEQKEIIIRGIFHGHSGY